MEDTNIEFDLVSFRPWLNDVVERMPEQDSAHLMNIVRTLDELAYEYENVANYANALEVQVADATAYVQSTAEALKDTIEGSDRALGAVLTNSKYLIFGIILSCLLNIILISKI